MVSHINALKRVDRHAGLKDKIGDIYYYHKGRYGYRRITLSLRKQGLLVNHKTVQRLMAELSLRSLIRVKRYRARKGEVGKAAPNILSRNFGASKANEKWVTNVTVFSVQSKKLYLSPVLDLFNREIISYSLLEKSVMENFFGTLKSECFYLNRFSDLNELRKAIEDYIHYYNNERINLKLKGLSPVEYRT